MRTVAESRLPAWLRELGPALVLGLGGLIWLIGASLTGPIMARSNMPGSTMPGSTMSGSGATGQLLVIGPPALDRDGVTNIVWQAGGAVIGSGGLPNIAIAAAESADFADALTAAGAWLVLPSPRLLGCFTDTGEAKP